MKFECTTCGQHLEGDTSMTGKEVQCPICCNPLTIPVGGISCAATDKSDPAAEIPLPSNPIMVASGPRNGCCRNPIKLWGRGGLLLAAAVCVIALVSVIIIAHMSYEMSGQLVVMPAKDYFWKPEHPEPLPRRQREELLRQLSAYSPTNRTGKVEDATEALVRFRVRAAAVPICRNLRTAIKAGNASDALDFARHLGTIGGSAYLDDLFAYYEFQKETHTPVGQALRVLRGIPDARVASLARELVTEDNSSLAFPATELLVDLVPAEAETILSTILNGAGERWPGLSQDPDKVAILLSSLGSESALPYLTEMLESYKLSRQDIDERKGFETLVKQRIKQVRAIEAVSRIPQLASVNLLLRYLEPESVPGMQKHDLSNDSSIAAGLNRLGHLAVKPICERLTSLHGQDAHTLSYKRALQQVLSGILDPKAVPDLLEAVEQQTPQAGDSAAIALSRIGRPVIEALYPNLMTQWEAAVGSTAQAENLNTLYLDDWNHLNNFGEPDGNKVNRLGYPRIDRDVCFGIAKSLRVTFVYNGRLVTELPESLTSLTGGRETRRFLLGTYYELEDEEDPCLFWGTANLAGRHSGDKAHLYILNPSGDSLDLHYYGAGVHRMIYLPDRSWVELILPVGWCVFEFRDSFSGHYDDETPRVSINLTSPDHTYVLNVGQNGFRLAEGTYIPRGDGAYLE